MSFWKKLLGILLILATFSVVFIFLFPSLYSDNPAGKFKKKIELDLDFLKDETAPMAAIFFGYVNCPDICVPALSELSKIYTKIEKKENIQVYFVNLQATAHPESVKEYVKVFNKDFKGIYLEYDSILEIVSKLKVVYLPSPTNRNIIDHSGYIHLLFKEDNKYFQKYIYTTRPFNIEYISKDINKMIGELR
jgi:protein SCO1/2